MKRFAFIITSLLVLSFGLANAQSGSVTLEVPVYNDGGTDYVTVGAPFQVGVRFTQNYGSNMTGSTNGIEVSSPDGAVWSYPVDAVNGAVPTGAISTSTMYDGGFFVNPFSVDGMGADTIGLGGFALFKPGIPSGFDEVVATIDILIGASEVGKTLCFDSCFYRPANSWTWSVAGGQQPALNGGGCWEIFEIPNLPPTITNCPGSISGSHCSMMTFDFNATDPEGDAYSFNLVSGPGTIAAGTGVWSYAPSLADVGVAMAITVNAADAFASGPNCVVDLTFTNQAPVFTGGCGSNVPVGMGNVAQKQMTASGVDCDPFTFSIANVSPAPVGALSINPNTGLITFNTVAGVYPAGDGGQTFTVTVQVSDGNASSTCDMTFEVLTVEPFGVRIEKTHMTFQGGHETVDITFEQGSELVGGFDFLVAYDASALTFVGALEGSIYAKCGWEYFTYRYGANGNCSGGCPSGLLRIVGIAETNNGANHPACFNLDPGDTFATLDFLVSDDRTLECQYVPIRFFWLDCGDNTLSSTYGDTLYISRDVFDFDLIGNIANGSAGYPTYFGAGDDCANPIQGKPDPVRFIDFFNGGIDIACADSIDARGDINLNEIANEIADAVLFSNYFIYGLGVFTINVQGQIAASDVNADGLALTVADLVYQIRIIVGDALPYPKVSPVSTTWSHNDGAVRVNSDMGAAYLVVAGNVVPTLLADNMEMKYNFDGANTRVLVYSEEAGNTFSGDFLNVNGDVVSIEMATYDGAPVSAKLTPATYALKQNYPNPFNPTTKIGFSLEEAGKYTLSIYNVTGRKVAEFSDYSEAGNVEVVWDAAGMASGIYFYQLEANNFSDTKKMVLLK